MRTVSRMSGYSSASYSESASVMLSDEVMNPGLSLLTVCIAKYKKTAVKRSLFLLTLLGELFVYGLDGVQFGVYGGLS